MAPRRKPAHPAAAGRLSTTTQSSTGIEPVPALPNIEALIDDDGQITIGSLYPIRCAAIANDGHNSLAMLVQRDGETLVQLLSRLDAAIAKAYDEDKFTDEVNAALSRQTSTRRR